MLALSGLAYDAEEEVRLSSPDIGVAIGKSDGDCIADDEPPNEPLSPLSPLVVRRAEKSLV